MKKQIALVRKNPKKTIMKMFAHAALNMKNQKWAYALISMEKHLAVLEVDIRCTLLCLLSHWSYYAVR